MSILMALSDSFVLAHIFSFLKLWTAEMLAVVFEVPWALLQKTFPVLFAHPHLAWVSSWKNVWKITSRDEVRIFFHARNCCQSTSRGDKECWEEAVFFSWAGKEVRWDIDAQMVLSTFKIQIPFHIAMYVPCGAGGDGKIVQHLLTKYVICQSVNMTVTD